MTGISGMCVGGILFLGYAAWVSRELPNPNGVIDRDLTVSSKIYDRKGETILYDVHGNIKRTIVTLNEIPDYAQKATIAVEDREFYKHRGFSVTGIIRSVFRNITTGSRVGGSTLTQQFVKNAILTNEKSYTRKLKEFILAYQLERRFSKDDILQMYFNEIPYGSVIYGIEAASQTFFGKSAKDLTLGEAAILAAIPQRPTYYSPYGSNRDSLVARQRYILDAMTELGYIDQAQATAAKEEKILFKPLSETIIAPHFVMYIRELISEEYGEDFITQEGLKVTTTLDLDKQKIAEDAVQQAVTTNGPKYNFTNAALVSVDAKNGEVLAMVGSADYFNDEIDGQVNVALRLRQPGSSFKPIVYAASFIKGFTPATILYDVVTNFDTGSGTPYQPNNYDLGERGPVSMKMALAGSLNIPAVKAVYLTGLDNVINLAEKLGYSSLKDKDRFGLSIVLGGAEVKLYEHVGAYAAFAQDGTRHPLTPILKIEDKNGRVLYEHKDKPEVVMDQQIARQINDILSDDSARAYIFGRGSKLTLPGRPVAAKTGTTNDYHDAWTIGYTPSLVTGVWVGNSNNDEMKRGADGSIVAAPIWNYYMQAALKDSPIESFTKPEPVLTGKGVLDGSPYNERIVKIDTQSGKLATEFTPPDLISEITIKEAHTILWYVNKDDPRGPAPDKITDPQFNNWESAVQRWAQAHGYFTDPDQIVPSDYDDIHRAEDQPSVRIISPTSQQRITQSTINVQIEASAPRGIKKIDYYIDDHLITSENSSRSVSISLANIDNGYHTLKVSARDDLNNTKSATLELNIALPNNDPPSVIWRNSNNTVISSFPYQFEAVINENQKIEKIDVYAISTTNQEIFIGYSERPGSSARFSWQTKPVSGTYKIRANIFTTSDKTYSSEELTISVP